MTSPDDHPNELTRRMHDLDGELTRVFATRRQTPGRRADFLDKVVAHNSDPLGIASSPDTPALPVRTAAGSPERPSPGPGIRRRRRPGNRTTTPSTLLEALSPGRRLMDGWAAAATLLGLGVVALLSYFFVAGNVSAAVITSTFLLVQISVESITRLLSTSYSRSLPSQKRRKRRKRH